MKIFKNVLTKGIKTKENQMEASKGPKETKRLKEEKKSPTILFMVVGIKVDQREN